MVDTEWPDSWRTAFRIELRAEAIGLAWRGWPVVPGTYPDAVSPGTEDTQNGRPAGWNRPVPVHDDWQRRLGAHPQQIAAWWTRSPHSLLVATGTIVDAVEVDAYVGREAAVLLRAMSQPAPIIAMPNGRWLFLTTAADRVPSRLAEEETVTWHSEGSWVPLPPSPFQHGVVHWRVKPDVWGWRLPLAELVHDVLVRALRRVAAPGTSTHRVLSAGSSAA